MIYKLKDGSFVDTDLVYAGSKETKGRSNGNGKRDDEKMFGRIYIGSTSIEVNTKDYNEILKEKEKGCTNP